VKHDFPGSMRASLICSCSLSRLESSYLSSSGRIVALVHLAGLVDDQVTMLNLLRWPIPDGLDLADQDISIQEDILQPLQHVLIPVVPGHTHGIQACLHLARCVQDVELGAPGAAILLWQQESYEMMHPPMQRGNRCDRLTLPFWQQRL